MGRKYNGLSAWKNLRPALGDFSGFPIEGGQRFRGTPRRRNPEQSGTDGRHEYDIPVFCPASTVARGGIAERDCRASLNRNFFQLAVSKEAEPFAIRRKEMITGTFSSVQHGGLQLIE